MDLDRNPADSQFAGDPLIQQASRNQTHHLFLARRELVETNAEFGDLRQLLARLPVAFQLVNRVEKVLIAKRLDEKLDGASFHCAHRHRHVAVAGAGV